MLIQFKPSKTSKNFTVRKAQRIANSTGTPFLWMCAQTGQVSWITPKDAATLIHYALMQIDGDHTEEVNLNGAQLSDDCIPSNATRVELHANPQFYWEGISKKHLRSLDVTCTIEVGNKRIVCSNFNLVGDLSQ